MSNNPFIINGVIPDELFCDRVRETEYIRRALLSGANVLLTSARRMGKTQLIRHIFTQKEIADRYYTFYTDIFATSSLQEFVFYLSKEIYAQLIPQGKKIYDSFIAALRSLSGCFSYDPISGVPAFGVKLGDIVRPELSLEEIFTYLEQADRPCIFAIDEFQRIASYPQGNVEALLRTHIQKMSNCNFIFAGSNRHLIENMFNSSARPFYNSASQYFLDKIAREVYVKFIIDCFTACGRVIVPNVACHAYDLFDGHTYYVHSLLHDVFTYSEPDSPVTIDSLSSTLEDMLENRSHSFNDQLSQLNYQQKEVLIAIAKEGKASGITSAAFCKKHSLTSTSSVQNAVRVLLDKELVTYEADGRSKTYSLSDRFLELWIRKTY